MMRPLSLRRLTVVTNLLLSLISTMVLVPSAQALGTETTITLRPHCIGGYADDNATLGSGGSDAAMRCPTFSVEDPQTLKTPPLSVGDIVDLDIVVENPDKKTINGVRTWLAYDPNILEGGRIDISPEFPSVTPGESDFSEAQGYAMIEGSAEGRLAPSDIQVFVARVQFTVRKTTPSGTVISFYDVQKDGHTTITTGSEGSETDLMTREPGVLHVIFGKGPGEQSSTSSTPSAQTSAISSAAPASSSQPPFADGDACTTNAQCRSGSCKAGICTPAVSGTPGSVPHGGSCGSNQECVSRLCTAGICIPPISSNASSSGLPEERTAFSLLQVQNLGITTEGTAVYVGWDALRSSQLKAYNVYYGTTAGRYIQRKTIGGTLQSLAIRGLPEGTTYYFAVRAVSAIDEESAFSQEVAVTVGDPRTSTAPLSASLIPQNGGTSATPRSPLARGTTVPGETGTSSTLAVLALISAVIGTIFASRRQLVATSSAHRP